jgi:hypothetical protein
MAKRFSYSLALAIFSAFMSLIYIGLGIFLLTTDYGIMIGETMGIVVGVVLISMGILRGIGAYQKFKSANSNNG